MDSENNFGDDFRNSEKEISKKIQDLECELTHLRKYQEELISKRINNDQKWNIIFFLIIILTLVSIPSILVFLDRWINLPEVKNYSRDNLCRIDFLCIDGLPGYFFWVIIFLVISCLVVFIYGGIFSSTFASIFRFKPELVIEHHYRINKTFIFGFILLIMDILLNIVFKRIPGAELLFIVLIFYIYLLDQEEISIIQELKRRLISSINYFKDNITLIFTIIFSFLFIILFLENYYESFRQINWIFFVFMLPVLYMVINQLKKLPSFYWITITVLLMYSIQMDNWLYTKIGDEYAFYYFARDLTNRPHYWQLSNLFSLEGVYGTHSVLSSIISHFFMRFLGFDHFGWIFSNYLLVLISIFIFYSFLKQFFDQKIAIVSVFLLSFSFYLIGFSRIGYNNLQALLIGSLTVWISGKFIKNKTISLAFILGISMGFLLYTFQAAYFYIPIVFIFYLLFNPPTSKKIFKLYLVTFFGFLLLAIPLFFQPKIMDILHQGTFFNKNYLVESTGTIFTHLRSNFVFSLFSYLFLFKESHYVMFSMIDPISAVFFTFGLLISVKNFRKGKIFQFLGFTYFLLTLSIGMIHDYPAPPITRMFIILPWIYCITAIGMYFVRKLVMSLNILSITWINFSSIFILIMIFVMNLLQSTLILQNKYAYYYFEPVVFKVMQYNTKKLFNHSEKPESYLLLTSENYDLSWMNMLQDVYKIPESKAQFYRIIYETEGISEDWKNKLESDKGLFIFAPTTFSEEIIGQISNIMAENGRNLCQLRYRKDSPVLGYMWIKPEKQFICEKLFNF